MRKFLTNKFTIIFIIILAIALPVTIWQVQRSQDVRQRASETTTILAWLNPASGTFTTGTPFSVDVNLSSANDVGSVQFTVNYDPAKISLISIDPQSPYNLATETSTSNSKTVTFLNITPTKVIGQNVKIATIQFSPISAGNTEVNINSVTFTVSGGTATLDTQSQLTANYTLSGTSVSPTVTTMLTPVITCTPRPGCLNQVPLCLIAEPPGGWCPGGVTITPSPTSTVQSGDTALKLKFTLSGVGATATASQQLNPSPIRPNRQGNLFVYDGNLQLIDAYDFTASYNPSTGTYNATADLNSLPTGGYLIKARLDNTLFKYLPGVQNITGGTSNSYEDPIRLASGDIVRTTSSDNVIDIADYSTLLSCLSATVSNLGTSSVGTPNCGIQTGVKADLNDDDTVDLKDLNILLRSFTSRVGD